MADYLGRGVSPLSQEQWQALDGVVVSAAKGLLVGRRLLPVYGPLGAGVAAVPTPQVTDGGLGRVLVELCETSADFSIDWKELEQAKALGFMEWGQAAMAAAKVASCEDGMIFTGCGQCGMPGLLTAPGRLEVKGGKWSEGEALFADVVTATTQLASTGFVGPYALVASPQTVALTRRWMPEGGDLHEMIEELVKAGIFASRNVPEKQMLVMQVGPQVADLAVGVDLTVAYTGNEGMTHLFRALETVSLRIKQAAGLCLVTGK